MSRRSTRYAQEGPRFSFHFLDTVKQGLLGGLTTNAEIAQVLRRHNSEINSEHVKKWRDEHPAFDRVCSDGLADANVEIANVAFEAARGGDPVMVKYWLDRRAPAFMPKQKTEFSGGLSLDDTLKQRKAMTDDELRASGVIYDPEAIDEEEGE